MGPREFAEAMYNNEKFYDKVSGKAITIYGGPDIKGDVIGSTDDGEKIKVNAKKLSLAGQKSSKSDSEKLLEILSGMGLPLDTDDSTVKKK